MARSVVAYVKRAVGLPHDERGVEALGEDARRPVALGRDALRVEIGDDVAQHRLVEALAERLVERDAQPLVHAVQHGETLGQEAVPELEVFGVARVQLGRFLAGEAGHVGMRLGELLQLRVRITGRDRLARRLERRLGRLDVLPESLELILGGLVPRVGGRLDVGERGPLPFDSRLEFRELRNRPLVPLDPVHQPIQRRQFLDGRHIILTPVSCPLPPELLPPVDDHPELGAPVADVVVAGDVVAEEAEDADEGVADDRAAEVAHVHRLGDVGGREVDDHPPWLGPFDAEPVVVDRLLQAIAEPVVLQPQVDEAGTGHLGWFAQVGDVESGDELGGDLARVPAENRLQRHRAVRLEVAETCVLRGTDHGNVRRHVFDERLENGREAGTDFGENVHGGRSPDCETASGAATGSGLGFGRLAEDGLPVDDLGIGPQAFEIVRGPRLGREDVQHDVAVVLQNPVADAVALETETLRSEFVHHAVDLLGDGVHLSPAVAAADHEEVDDGRDAGEIEHADVLAAVVVGDLCAPAGKETTLANLIRTDVASGFDDDGHAPRLRERGERISADERRDRGVPGT